VAATYTAALITRDCIVTAGRATALPTGGTALAKCDDDGLVVSNSNLIVRAANASDGGVATPITATMGTIRSRNYIGRLHTVVGQVKPAEGVALVTSTTSPRRGLFIANAAGAEAVLVQLTATAAGSNPATNHYIVNIEWEEWTA